MCILLYGIRSLTTTDMTFYFDLFFVLIFVFAWIASFAHFLSECLYMFCIDSDILNERKEAQLIIVSLRFKVVSVRFPE